MTQLDNKLSAVKLFKNYSHESYDRKEKLKVGSDKNFGLVFAALFALIAFSSALPQIGFHIAAGAASIFFLLAALLKPTILHGVNAHWSKFGLLLSKIISPIVLVILFYIVFLPIGLFLKIINKDILNKKIDKAATTYWINSAEPVSTMKEQF